MCACRRYVCACVHAIQPSLQIHIPRLWTRLEPRMCVHVCMHRDTCVHAVHTSGWKQQKVEAVTVQKWKVEFSLSRKWKQQKVEAAEYGSSKDPPFGSSDCPEMESRIFPLKGLCPVTGGHLNQGGPKRPLRRPSTQRPGLKGA